MNLTNDNNKWCSYMYTLPEYDRRCGYDRRSNKPTPPLPFLDNTGMRVTSDRSRRADRRLNSIQAQWVNDTRDLLRPF